MGLNILVCVDDVAKENLTGLVTNVEVVEKIDQNTHYKLTFMIDISNGDIAKEMESDTIPGKMISVLAMVDDNLICLVKGPVTQQEENLQHGGPGSCLHIEGEDSAHKMDGEVKFHVYDAVTDADIATKIISSNDSMTPDVEATAGSTHNEENHSFVQRESDLSLVRSLAKRNGFHFWVTWSDTGQATGHFKSRSLDGEPVAELIVNMENNNIDCLKVIAEATRPFQTEGNQLNLRTKETFGGTVTLNDPKLGKDGLAAVAANKVQSMHLAPVVDDAGAMKARSEAALRDAQWFINATCTTSLHRLGKIIRNHTVIMVQGAGTRQSGKYYVTGVKHNIDAAAYIMEVELARNAWGNESAGSDSLLSKIF
ncbi:MAG: hypothetical protein ABI723_10630 [Bacteroidia bacterium]